MFVIDPFTNEKLEITLSIAQYHSNDNLAIQLYCEDGPYVTLTVNIDKLSDNLAAVDTNNFREAEKFINNYELGEFTGKYLHSGFCEYPVYDFTKLINSRKEE